jgi:hypothetical protein
MHLGIVTYQIAGDLDLTSLIELCQRTRIEGFELRTTHDHGVEPSLSTGERAAVNGLRSRSRSKSPAWCFGDWAPLVSMTVPIRPS